jgi:hypothetical protein
MIFKAKSTPATSLSLKLELGLVLAHGLGLGLFSEIIPNRLICFLVGMCSQPEDCMGCLFSGIKEL